MPPCARYEVRVLACREDRGQGTWQLHRNYKCDSQYEGKLCEVKSGSHLAKWCSCELLERVFLHRRFPIFLFTYESYHDVRQLEDVINAYEHGAALRRRCEAKLTKAEERVAAVVERADCTLT